MNKLKRYLLFLVGLFINALGVSLITKASLGTSPISSIPYVLSLNFKFTLGNFTIFFSIFLILLQILILRKNFKLENILQIPVSIAFGYFIDLTARLCFGVMDSTYSLYAWSRTFLSAPYDTLDKFFCFCSSDVLAELLCLVVGCAMVFPSHIFSSYWNSMSDLFYIYSQLFLCIISKFYHYTCILIFSMLNSSQHF